MQGSAATAKVALYPARVAAWPAAVTAMLAAVARIATIVRTRLAVLGVEPSGNTPAEFRVFMEAEVARRAKVIDAAKTRLD